MERILISGGNGLIGRHLCQKLTGRGYQVAILSRSGKPGGNLLSYYWDPDNNEMDPEAVDAADYIIHLAGANIGEKRWTPKRKQEILDSRVKPGQLIFNSVKANSGKLKAFISASATGYYGAIGSQQIFRETDPPALDYLGETCRQWEQSALQFESAGIRTVMIRTGVVLSPKGGALSKMATLVRYGLGSPLGSGRQFLPWIHLDDLCEIYIKALEDRQMNGAYNAVSPAITTNKEFYKTLARVLKKPLWLPPVPSFVLKIVLGEMSAMLLEGSRVSSVKIRAAGFNFRFPELQGALNDVMNSSSYQ